MRHSIAGFLVAMALAMGSAHAAESGRDTNRPARQLKQLLKPVDGGQPGVLVAPGCPSCQRGDGKTLTSPIDWLKAQIVRLVS